MERTAERITFLNGLIVIAIENYGHGWFVVDEYDTYDDETKPYRAVIWDQEEPQDTATRFEVTPDVMARGIGIIKRAVLKDFIEGKDEYARTDTVLANAETGQRLYMSEGQRKAILEASRDNDAGQMDCVDAMAIMEVALFGAVTYA